MKQKTKDAIMSVIDNHVASPEREEWINDLLEIECEPEPLELWVNVVDGYTSSINWTTEKEAIENRAEGAKTIRMVQANDE